MDELKLVNCRLPGAGLDDPLVSIRTEGGLIKEVHPIDVWLQGTVIDVQGRLVTPGFIDVHVQGAGGADVLDGTAEALGQISRACARFGVTGFLATTVYMPGQANEHLMAAASAVGRDLGGARLLGIHIEGPFIAPQRRGMIQPSCLSEPSPQVMQDIFALTGGALRMMTIAPELPGALALVEMLTQAGAVASFGHSAATYEKALQGFEAGISHVTHLFNAMPAIHHRDPGPLPAIFESAEVTCQLIPDGVHAHPAVVRLAFEMLGPDRTIPITDGMQAMGLPDGTYLYHGIEYESKEGAARYHDGTLIGTALGMSSLVERLAQFTGCSFTEAAAMAGRNPARLLGLSDRKQSIEPGKDADLVVFNTDHTVLLTIAGGRVVFDGRGDGDAQP